MTRRRLIDIGKNITLFPKILPGIGLREIVLLGLAALQAVYFAFYAEALALGVRLTLAMLIAIPILIVASVPFRGMTFERWLWQQFRGALEPKRFRHTTADPRQARAPDTDANVDTPALTAETAPRARPAAASGGALALATPNLGLVMALFVCLLLLSSVLAYATRAAGLP